MTKPRVRLQPRVDADVARRAKAKAVTQGRTLESVVETLLDEWSRVEKRYLAYIEDENGLGERFPQLVILHSRDSQGAASEFEELLPVARPGPWLGGELSVHQAFVFGVPELIWVKRPGNPKGENEQQATKKEAVDNE